MRNKILQLIATIAFLAAAAGPAGAGLAKIGEAVYDDGRSGEAAYSLIYDDESNLVWLDYSHGSADWQVMADWAQGLNEPGVLIYYMFDEYRNFQWTGNWRLPDARNADNSSPDQGYASGSEMGHLYYNSLGLGAGGASENELNAGLFDHLNADQYFSGTRENETMAWAFNLGNGYQAAIWDMPLRVSAIAVREGTIEVPLPAGAGFLAGGLLIFIYPVRRRRK